MKTQILKLYEVDHYTGSSYNSFTSLHDSKEAMLECLRRNQDLKKHLSWCAYNNLSHRLRSEPKIEISNNEVSFDFKLIENQIECIVSNLKVDHFEIKKTAEVKQEGVPYVPEKEEKVFKQSSIHEEKIYISYREKEMIINGIYLDYHKVMDLDGNKISVD